MSRVEDRATYVIINAKSGTVMDLSGADNESGMYLHLQIDHWINSTMQLSDTQATAGRTSRYASISGMWIISWCLFSSVEDDQD